MNRSTSVARRKHQSMAELASVVVGAPCSDGSLRRTSEAPYETRSDEPHEGRKAEPHDAAEPRRPHLIL